MCLANVSAISERAALDDHPTFLTLILYTQKPRPPSSICGLKVILRKTRSCRPYVNDISFSSASVCRWITSAVWAVVGRAARCWPTRMSWASSQRSTSWPPERDTSTAGWATPGSCSSPRCAAEVRQTSVGPPLTPSGRGLDKGGWWEPGANPSWGLRSPANHGAD